MTFFLQVYSCIIIVTFWCFFFLKKVFLVFFLLKIVFYNQLISFLKIGIGFIDSLKYKRIEPIYKEPQK